MDFMPIYDMRYVDFAGGCVQEGGSRRASAGGWVQEAGAEGQVHEGGCKRWVHDGKCRRVAHNVPKH